MRNGSLVLPAFGLLTLVLFAALPARAGDPDVAKLLYEKAEKAARSRDWEEAENYYRRALEEYSPLPDAAYGLGEVLEKQGKTSEAIDAYLLCKDQILGLESPGRTETRLLERAEKAVKRLGAGYAELADIDKAFVKDCLAFGRRFFHSDPGWAKKAFEHAIELEPGNRLVQGYLERLADAKGPVTAGGAFESLIRDDKLSGWAPGIVENWTCKGGILVATPDDGPGESNWVKDFLEGKYTLSGRFRLPELKGVKPAAGFMFGRKGGSEIWGIILVASKSEVALSRFTASGNEDMRSRVLNNFDPAAWHELKIEVTPGKVVGYVDNREVFSLDGQAADAFDGPAGIFAQQCRLEVKEMGVQR